MTTLTANNLVKHYGSTVALNGLSFQINAGSVYGLIGANGAGKTTTLAILAGLMRPTSGDARIFDCVVEPNNREIASKIGFASPQYALFDYLTGREILVACGLMHGLDRAESARRSSDLLEYFDLENAADNYLHQYSQGMRQKIGLACGFVHAPPVLLLDEPFVGLDTTSVYRLSGLIEQVRESGRSVLLTSHDLALVERLCDCVGILHEGRIKREIDLSDLETVSAGSKPRAFLESSLWETVGAPEERSLAWI